MYSFLIKDNEQIANFLGGDDSYIPTSEISYLHSRPLIRPNFITEIGDLIDKVGSKVEKAKLSGKPIDDLTSIALELGFAMGKPMDAEVAKQIAFSLRKVYKLCLDLDSKL